MSDNSDNPDNLDALQRFQLQESEAALNREAAKQQFIDWEYTVINQVEELCVWLVHVYAQLTHKGMPHHYSMLTTHKMVDVYLAYHGGKEWFTKMPDITGLIASYNADGKLPSAPKEPDPEEEPPQ